MVWEGWRELLTCSVSAVVSVDIGRGLGTVLRAKLANNLSPGIAGFKSGNTSPAVVIKQFIGYYRALAVI